MAKSIGSAVLDLIYPPRCPCCGELNGEAHLCEVCAAELEQLEHPLQGFGDCEAVAAAFNYEGPGRSFLLRYKRGGLRGIAGSLAPYVAVAVRRQLGAFGFSCCTCVPGGLKSARERGFSASEVLAGRVAALLGLPFVTLLQHTGYRSQKELDRAARFRNAAESFRLAPGAQPVEQGGILLIDDIMTTGASLEACAALLCEAGAPFVAAAVAAYDPPS